MGPVEATLGCMARPLGWSGRACRAEFWWFTLVMNVAQGIALAPLLAPPMQVLRWWAEANAGAQARAWAAFEAFEPLPFPDLTLSFAAMTPWWLLFLLVAVPLNLAWLAAMVRRLHDTDHSGWWYWVTLFPVFGMLFLVLLLATPSRLHRNRYGPGPVVPRAQAEGEDEAAKVLVVIDTPEALRALRQARMQG